ncbi:hypothetical protein DS878_01305 [Marinobacter sp. F3R11]|nr:hypothetical protein DS878_01305 [Marinobacter sp. F3R11]
MLDNQHAMSSNRLKLNIDWQASGNLQLRSEVWALSSPERLDGKREDAGISELYIRNRDWLCTPALGKKQVIWGRADGINPTDLVSPTNYRRLTPERNDQRSGNWGLHLDCAVNQGRLQIHALNHFRFNDVPLPTTTGVQFIEEDPSVRPTLAVKYDVLGSTADWSVSVIDGHDLFPTFALRNITSQGITLGQHATRMRMLGSDLTLVRGGLAYRAEIAWVDFHQASNTSVARRRPYTSLIAGAEWYLGDSETVSLQSFWRHLKSLSQPSSDPLMEQIQDAQSLVSNELDTDQYGITFRYAKPLIDSKADLDIFAVWTEPRGDWMLRGRLKYALTDNFRINTGFEFFGGPEESYLGRLRNNSLTFVEASYLW